MSPALAHNTPPPPGSLADAELARAASRRDALGIERWAPQASSSALRLALLSLCHAGQDASVKALLELPAPAWIERDAAIAEALAYCLERNKRSVFSATLPFSPAFDPLAHAPLILSAAAAFGHAPFWAEALVERFGRSARVACLSQACQGACAPAFAQRMAQRWGPASDDPMPELDAGRAAALRQGSFKLADHLFLWADPVEARRAVEEQGAFRLPKTAERLGWRARPLQSSPIDPVAAAAALLAARQAAPSAAQSSPREPNRAASAPPAPRERRGMMRRALAAFRGERGSRAPQSSSTPPMGVERRA